MIQNSFLLVILFGAMGLSIFAREFFILFAGEGYQTVYYYVPMVQMGVVFSAMTMLYSTIITARQKTKINSIITITGSCISIILNIKLLPILGITAACLTSAISLGVILVLSVYYAKIKIGYRPFVVFLIAVVTVWLPVYAFSIDNIWCSMIIKGLLMVMAAMAIFPILRFNPLKIMSSFRNNNL
jgi:O-antigen/teichoic acid export membrane protein